MAISAGFGDGMEQRIHALTVTVQRSMQDGAGSDEAIERARQSKRVPHNYIKVLQVLSYAWSSLIRLSLR